MGYIKKKFFINEKIKAYKFLIDNFDCSMREAQKWIDKKRLTKDGETVQVKNKPINGNVEVIVFQPEPMENMPIFETDDFAVFEKPSGVLVHPNKISSEYTLNDDIKFLFGKDANAVHRIDKETSGLVMVAKDKNTEITLKKMFENREIKKEYLALVDGEIKVSQNIDADLKMNLKKSIIKIKAHVVSYGLKSVTQVEPLEYIKDKNVTLIKAKPLTGRTHQIRAHMFHVKHCIIGDPIYGVDEKDVKRFLEGKMDEAERLKIAGAKRLMLHANVLRFKHKNIEYNIKSKINIKEVFYE